MPFTDFPIPTSSIETVATGGYALRITPGAGGTFGGNNVNCGLFWERGASLGSFSWEAWTQPLGGADYWISDGHGGAHAILCGWDANPSNLKVSGNIWDTPGSGSGSVVSFSSVDTVPANTLHHTLVCWDGSNIYVFLDGVLTNVVAHTGDRGNSGGGEDGILYLGGSDHSNFAGWMFRVRAYEEILPFDSIPAGYFYPEWFFKAQHGTSAFKSASFLMDFTQPAFNITDKSAGYNGSPHPGVLSVGNDYSAFTDAQHRSTAYPTFELMPFEQSAYAGATPTTTPGSAIFFDEFRRQDITPAWYDTVNRPANTAPTGQTWSTNTGIISEKAYVIANSEDTIYVDLSTPDIDVTFTNGNTNKKLSYVVRRTDANNYILISTALDLGLYDINVVNYTAGVPTTDAQAVGALPNENFTTLRVVLDGGDVEVFIDGVSKLTGTTTRTTGNKIGVVMLPLNRLDKVEAYAA